MYAARHALDPDRQSTGYFTGPSPMSAYRADLPRRLLCPFLILNDDSNQQPETPGRGGQKAQNGESRVAEYAKRRLYAHHERGADDQGGENDSGRDSIGDFLESFHYQIGIDRPHLHLELGMRDRIQYLVEARGQAREKILQLEQRAPHAA